MKKIGIIGTGAIGRVHARHAKRVGLEVAGAWDTNPAAMREFQNEQPHVAMEPTLASLLSRRDVDGVILAIPNDLHEPLAIQALAAGKHVLLEKPMAITVAACDRMLDAARNAGRTVQMGFVCRHLPAVAMARQLAIDQRFGNIYHVKASMYRRRGVPGLGGWFTTKAKSGGGSLIDLGVHLLDAALDIMGHPKIVRVSGATYSTFGKRMKEYAYTSMWAGPPNLSGVCDVEDHVTALLRCEGGATIELNATWAMNIPDGVLPDGLAIFGDRSGCKIGLQDQSVLLATEAGMAPTDETLQLNADNPMDQAWDGQARAFMQLLAQSGEATATALQGRTVQAVIDAIYQSAREDREVSVT